MPLALESLFIWEVVKKLKGGEEFYSRGDAFIGTGCFVFSMPYDDQLQVKG